MSEGALNTAPRERPTINFILTVRFPGAAPTRGQPDRFFAAALVAALMSPLNRRAPRACAEKIRSTRKFPLSRRFPRQKDNRHHPFHLNARLPVSGAHRNGGVAVIVPSRPTGHGRHAPPKQRKHQADRICARDPLLFFCHIRQCGCVGLPFNVSHGPTRIKTFGM